MMVSNNSAPNASGVRDCEVEIRIKIAEPFVRADKLGNHSRR